LGDVGYHLWQNNCEHFAVWCKTGRPQSSQIDAIEQSSQQFSRAATIATLGLRLARRLPTPYQPWAVGVAFAYTGGAAASRYWKCRRQSMGRHES
jgi:hypothetical protein